MQWLWQFTRQDAHVGPAEGKSVKAFSRQLSAISLGKGVRIGQIGQIGKGKTHEFKNQKSKGKNES
jgi:hypothetical protein